MARRGWGGHVYKRGRSFGYRIRRDGKQVTKQGYPTRESAHAAMMTYLQEAAKRQALGLKPIPEKPVSSLLPSWKQHASVKVSAGHFGNMVPILEAFAEECPKAVSAVTPADIEDFIAASISGGSIKPQTGNRWLAYLSNFFRWAEARGYCHSNPCGKVPKAKEEERPVPFLTPEDVARIASRCPEWMRPVVTVASETGLRRGELLALCWQDVSFERQELTVRRSKSKRVRVVPLSDAAIAALGSVRADATVALNGETRVFPYLGHRVTAAFCRAADLAGFSGLVFHGLRHAFCSRLAQSGVPLPTISALAGHAGIGVTMRYAKHAPQDAGRVAIRGTA